MSRQWKGKYRVEQENMKREERDQRTVDHFEEYLLRERNEPNKGGTK